MKKIMVLFYALFLIGMEERVNTIELTKLHLQKLYETAKNEYHALSPEVKKVNLDYADVKTMLGKLHYELQEKNPNKSLEWFSRIKVRTQLDSEWLNNQQKIVLADLFVDLEQKVMEIQPKTVGHSELAKLFDEHEYEAMSWIFDVVRNKKCSGLEWRALLADPTQANPYLLPTMLFEQRLKKILLLYKSGKYGEDFAHELQQFNIK